MINSPIFSLLVLLFNFFNIMATKITPEDRELIIKIARLFIDSPYMF
jgi:hypothetical protein